MNPAAIAMQHQTQVKKSLQDTIKKFFAERLSTAPQYTGQDFLTYVFSRHSCAANSPLRIMQVLKKEGAINYKVVEANYLNRRDSVYEALPTNGEVHDIPLS
jgi:hypothetical protein